MALQQLTRIMDGKGSKGLTRLITSLLRISRVREASNSARL